MGYILFWIFSDTLEIHDIAVKKKYHRQDIGSQLMKYMLEIARSNDVKELFLEVRKSNTAALKFYHKFNFKKIRERRDYYKNPVEDAWVLGLYLL
jgi:ribosomal-protein-alanine N-acetyltransferase